MIAQAHHAALIKEWKHDIEVRRDQARSYLIDGADTTEIRDDETQIEIVTAETPIVAEIPTSPFKMHKFTVPPVTMTTAAFLPTKMDVVRKFTPNSHQKYAFMIIASHLDGDNQVYTGKYFIFS